MKIVRTTSFLLVATFFGLWLSVYLPLEFELFLSYVLIISFGILHGANDVEVLTSYFHKREISMSKVSLTLLYILLIATIYAIFYVFPAIALLLFVVFSGYHFGEQHWSGTLKRQLKGKSLFYTLYGALILFMLFYSHIPQVGGIVKDITGNSVPTYIFGQIFLGLGISVGLFLLYFGCSGSKGSSILLELFLLGVFYVIFNTASLLWAFCIYFVIWHSIPSLLDQMRFLYGEVSWKTFYRYFRSSFVYWLVSVLGTLGLYLFLKINEEFLLSSLICFLASITVPHVLVMTKIEEYLKTHPKANIGGDAQ
ncbi:Brp/Blh family beta-carotene 15,15'-dioxygenase [Muricauda sp. NFXS6]|uniref:Brp/Blh family beta-carotene 15,15'-dioxygenase n=1 Tax=Flavobacteriaceae TaxID=49546 RepID=UPI0032DFBDCB